MATDELAAANGVLRAKGYAERQLAVHPAPGGRALLKGDRILAPFADDPPTILRVVLELVPPAAELVGQLRPAELRERQLAVHPAPGGRALLKGDRILAPFADDPRTILRVVLELVPPAAELVGQLRPAELRERLG